MCKIFAIAGIERGAERRAVSLLRNITPMLTKVNTDGFGYAAYTPETNAIRGERWLNVEHAWRVRLRGDQTPIELRDAVETVDGLYNNFGSTKRAYRSALIAHARSATSKKGMRNVHPFVRDTPNGPVAFVHNGVISNVEELDLSGSDDCDSAGILNAYCSADVGNNPKAIQDMADEVSGWYACAVLGHDGKRPYVDIFKNDTARLSMTIVSGVGTVWSTDEADVFAAARACGFRVSSTGHLRSGILMRLDAVTGNVMQKVPFTPRKREYVATYYTNTPYTGRGANYAPQGHGWQRWLAAEDEEERRVLPTRGGRRDGATIDIPTTDSP